MKSNIMYSRTLVFLLLFYAHLLYGDEMNQVKGVMLERINHFISYSTEGDKYFHICVYDDKKLFRTFVNVFNNRELHNLPIMVDYKANLSTLDMCEVFYSSEGVDMSAFDMRNTLLVTGNIDSLNKGYMVALYPEKNKIRFAINQQRIVESNLKVSYRLLQVASKVINPLKN